MVFAIPLMIMQMHKAAMSLGDNKFLLRETAKIAGKTSNPAHQWKIPGKPMSLPMGYSKVVSVRNETIPTFSICLSFP